MKGVVPFLPLVASSVVSLVLLLLSLRVAKRIILRAREAEKEAKRQREEARRTLEDARRRGRDEYQRLLKQARQEGDRLKREAREMLSDAQRRERRLEERERQLSRREQQLRDREQMLHRERERLERERKEVEELKSKWKEELMSVAALSEEEARQLLLKQVEQEIRDEANALIRQIEEQAKEQAEQRAREIIATAIAKCAPEAAQDSTVTVVSLPNDEMKGRIIGREGRNIRHFEKLTGVDLIIDDTPEAVVISSFDPIRREIARVALERLVADGRIHPAQIEEAVEKARREVERRIFRAGEEAAQEVGVMGIDRTLIRLLGRLAFRTSYGQNVLQHSIEVAQLAAAMAAELGADVALAKRAGLLHDIGKAVDIEVEGPHAAIGADLAKKHGESPAVVHAIEAHHGDVEPKTVEAVLVQAADALSASRPGARRESIEHYIQRLERLEAIASAFDGVEKAYAIQAGREVRIIVDPGKVDDLAAARMAKEIAKRIEQELKYPGQIKVVVIRETRAVEHAK